MKKENALHNIGYGLYVLSANLNGVDNACIINTLMQLTSIDPVLCLITVNKQALTHDMIMDSKCFNVSFLTTDTDFALIKQFGYQSGKDVDKFASFKATKRSDNGLLYLTEYVNSFMSFTVKETIDFGSHTMFIGLITESKVLNDKESLTYEYYQQNIKPKPTKKSKVGYRCTICDYFHEGPDLPSDFICPICSHGADVFVKEE